MSSQTSIHGEIREQQQKTKDMNMKDKLKYFWYYYKVHTIVAVGLIALVIMLVRQYASNKEYALYVTLINAELIHLADNEWDSEFEEYAGIDTNEYCAYIDTSIGLSNASSPYAIVGTEKLFALLEADVIDVIVSDTDTFEKYAQEELFLNLESALPAVMLDKYRDSLYYTDASTFGSEGADTSFTLEDVEKSDTTVINHRDPSSMEQPVPVGICLSEGNKITDSGCYDYLKENNVTFQGYPAEAILGIPLDAQHFDMVLNFLEFLEE